MADLKIKLVVIDGEKRVDPETMALLLEIAGHRDVCDACFKAWRIGDGKLYCTTGRDLTAQLVARPDVSIE